MVVNIIFWILFGLICGWITILLSGVQAVTSILLYVVLGVIGGISGGVLSYLFITDSADLRLVGMLASILGAAAVLCMSKIFFTKNGHHI